METIAAMENATRCEGPGCHRLVEQQPGGHRRRRFCSDDCKQRAYRARVEEKRQQEVRERWSDFSPATQQYLDWLVKRNDDRRDFVNGIVEIIKRERGESPLSEEEARAQARLHCYIGNSRYLGSTQRLFVQLYRMRYHEIIDQVAIAINQERGHQQQAIEALPPINETVNEQYQQYGQWLLEYGKRLKYHALSLNVYKERCPGLFGETDIYDIEGDRSHWEAAAFSFSPEGQLVAIAHAHQAEFLDRLLEQERGIAREQAFQSQVRLASVQRDAHDYSTRLMKTEDRLSEMQKALTSKEQRVAEQEQELQEERTKFKELLADYMQAAKKIVALERRVRRVEYMKIVKSRESMLHELLVLGGRLNYVSMTDLGIGEGIDQWLNYIRGVSDEDLAKAIAHGYYQADTLAMAAIEASDKKIAMQMRKRIDDLERDISLRNGRIAELEHGQDDMEPGDELSKEQIQELLYHARERQAIIENQTQQIQDLEREVRQNITKIHQLEESHGSTMFRMNNLLAAAHQGEVETQRVAELEREIDHLKARIEKQYERRIAKQRVRIEELEHKIEKQSAHKSDAIELEQVRADLLQIRQDRAREQAAFHEIYDQANDQRIQFGAALNRIKDLEEEVEKARRGGEGVQIRFRNFVRMTHEKQLTHDQEEGKLPTREEMMARLLVVGERLQYCRLLVPHIQPGLESWQHFIERASFEQLGQAVTNAEHYYENLVYLDELELRIREVARERKVS